MKVKDLLTIAAVCAMGAPLIANANPVDPGHNQYRAVASQSDHYKNVPGASYSAANGGPAVRGNNLPSGGMYNGPGYGHAYPKPPAH